MVHQAKLRVDLPTAGKHWELEKAAGKGTTTLVIPLPKLKATPGTLRYTLDLLDQHGNVVQRFGGTDSPVTVELVEPPPPPPPSPATDSRPALTAAELRQQAARARQTRRTRTLWGYSALGAGLACVSVAAVLYGVGGAQGSDAYDKYEAALTDDDLLRYGDDVEAATDKLTAGHVLAGVGVAAVAASVYLLLTRPKTTETRAGLGLVLARQGAVLRLQGRF
jgi:hypothetical protein